MHLLRIPTELPDDGLVQRIRRLRYRRVAGAPAGERLGMLTVDKKRLARMALLVALILGTYGAHATAAARVTAVTTLVCRSSFVPKRPEKEAPMRISAKHNMTCQTGRSRYCPRTLVPVPPVFASIPLRDARFQMPDSQGLLRAACCSWRGLRLSRTRPLFQVWLDHMRSTW